MSVVTAGRRNRLNASRERVRAARAEVRRARDGVDAASKLDDHQALVACQVRLQQAEDEAEVASELERVLLGQFAGIDRFGDEGFLDDPLAVRQLEQLANSKRPIDQVTLGPVMSAESFASMIESGDWGPRPMAASTLPDTPAGRRGPWTELGVVRQLRRRIRLLDLIPTRTMSGNSIPYTIESGNLDTAAETAETVVKPVGDIGITDAEARARTIANYIKAPRQVLADVPDLEGVIRDRLVYAVLRRLENQILSGDGVGENLLGILGQTGISDVAFAAGTPLADLALSGITAALVSNVEPDGVVIHPTSAQSMLTAKATGSGQYLAIDSPIGTLPDTLWGLPLVTSTVVPVGQALVGSFAEGAILWIREAVNVVIGMESDDMIRNVVTLLGEMRAALTVIQPTAFALVHLQ
jgi:HK97 family phage major capsid protein